MQEEIYFDNAATTRPYDEVIDVLLASAKEYYNPSSIYNRAIAVSKKIENVRLLLMRSVFAEKGSFIFTSGGTESINTMLHSIAKGGKKIITTAYEHEATLRAVEQYGDKMEIVEIRPKSTGVSIEEIVDAVDEKTALVSVMHVNNETGHIIDIRALGKKIKKKNPRTLFHVDAIQSYMKLELDVEDMEIDFLSISAHKIHGVKGVGALYVRPIQKFKPLLLGGGQEKGQRSGTENVPGILALGKAVEIGIANRQERIRHLSELRAAFLRRMTDIEAVVVNSPEEGAPHIVNLSFLGVPSEILLHSLEEHQIYVSAGSACSAKKKGSRVLQVLGLSDEVRNSAIRFSFSTHNTVQQIEQAAEVIQDAVLEIRKITRFRNV